MLILKRKAFLFLNILYLFLPTDTGKFRNYETINHQVIINLIIMLISKKLLLWGFISLLSTQIYAQQSLIYSLPDQNLKKGIQLYEKQKYVDAQNFFDNVIEKESNKNSETAALAQYYASLCAAELFNADAESRLENFISSNPSNSKVNDAYFSLAHYLYNNKKYNKAVEWFEKVDIHKLTGDQLPQYHFETGYCYFMTKNLDKAKLHFYEIKDIDTKYTSAALYYYSHIAYEQKNYETALEGFLRLKDDDTFASIVPYYISQIYFLQKKYDKVVEYAPPLLDSVVEKRVAEMSRIIGESYYRLGKYTEALPYLEKYSEKVKSMTPEDRYQLAFAYYKATDYDNAIKNFEPITLVNSSLSQNALYHLADCYIQKNDKQKARLAFYSASSMDFDPVIKENSLYYYAVATYELSLSPFNEAVKAFNDYLKLYPNSGRSDVAYNYLMLAYMTTKNYRAALESLNKIKIRDNNVRKAYQHIAFFRGLELFNNQKFDSSIIYFDKSLEYQQFDKTIAARSYYWKGEANYRLHNYEEANDLYNRFISFPEAAGLNEYDLINYNIGYTYFNLKKYDESLDWFKRYTESQKKANKKNIADAYNRLGDCYFMKQSYWVAIENYEKAIDLKAADSDYSLFQKAFSLGLVNRPEKKVLFLNQLLKDYSKSSYVDEALFELGRAYITLNSNDQAIKSFNVIINDYQTSSYVPKALLQLGLIYFNQDKSSDAITAYKRVIDQYPGSPESRDAYLGLKSVYVDKNDVDTYFAYLESKGQSSNVRVSEQDSLTYASAENIYMNGDCDKSVQQFSRYLEKYKNGNFIINANYYIADCNNKNQNQDEALKGYEFVIGASRNMFTEQSLLAAAKIYFIKENYSRALQDYKQLETVAEIKSNVMEARIGQMRCYYKLADYDNSISAARVLLNYGNLPDEISRESHYVLAKSFLETNNQASAADELRLVAKDIKSKEGSECKYLLAKLYYDQNKKDEAMKEIMNFIDKNTPYQYWLGKSFILLSDIYVDKNDEFQAVNTLQSILDYYENTEDGIKNEAKEKHDKLVSQYAGSQVKDKQQDVEVQVKK